MKRYATIVVCALLITVPGAPVNVAGEPVTRFNSNRSAPTADAATPETTPVAPPRAVIAGPTEGYPGDFIDLDSSKSICKLRKWKIRPERFTDGKQSFKLSDDGVKCQLSSRPGVTYEIQLIVANEVGIDDLTQKVVIADVLPPTKPQDPPPTTPTVPPVIPTPNNPTVPDSLTDWARDAATRLVTADPSRAETAKKLAESYRKWAVNGAVSTNAAEFAKAMDILAKGVVSLRGVAAAWDPYFREYATKMQSLGMHTVQEHITACQQLAAGLEQVR